MLQCRISRRSFTGATDLTHAPRLPLMLAGARRGVLGVVVTASCERREW